jgi:YesN/AraC family two-component response regulator
MRRSEAIEAHITGIIVTAVMHQDARGFRRVFCKIVGLTPSDYRFGFSKIHRKAIEIASE